MKLPCSIAQLGNPISNVLFSTDLDLRNEADSFQMLIIKEKEGSKVFR